VPRILGTPDDDLIQSPVGRSTVRAFAGNDTVLAAAEDDNRYDNDFKIDRDIVYLGAGDDLATGFVSNDVIYGGRGNDTVEARPIVTWLNASGGNTRINGEAGNDHLTGYHVLDGGTGNDTLIGGGRMMGRAGNDVYVLTIDSLAESIVDRQGKTVIDATPSRWESYPDTSKKLRFITADGRDEIHVSDLLVRLIKTGGGGDAVSSGDMAHFPYGNWVKKVIAGHGKDTVDGADRIFGGDGRDELSRGMFVDGGRHGDIISNSGNRGWVRGGDGNDTISDSENVYGGAGSDHISQSMNVRGGGGDDIIEYAQTLARGGGGDDFVGGIGLLGGDNGDDTLVGQNEYGESDDTLEGGRGADVLHFGYGEGDDVLRGGNGTDTFVLTSFVPDEPAFLVDTVDTIEDFEIGTDIIDLGAYAAVTEFADLVIEQSGAFALVKDQGDYVLVSVADVLASDLTADDFVF